MRLGIGLATVLAAAVLPGVCAAQVMVPSGTKISCRLEQTISSATADEGQPVNLSVTEDVKVGETVVVKQGAACVGSIVEATAKRRMGRTGKLDFSIEKVRTVDGEYIPLRYTMNKKEGGSSAVSTGVMTAGAAVLFWPAAPFFLLRKGKDVTINKGIVLGVFTDADHTVKMQGPMLTQNNGAPAPAAGLTALTVTSNIANAEVELDGAFVGNVPMTRQVPPGSHRIVVKSPNDVWQRTLDVQAGSPVNINASLKR